jgi:hypothetical protein
MWISEDIFYDTIAAAGLQIRKTVKEAIALRVLDGVSQVALFLMAKCFPIAYEKLKVARIRLIDVWIVNLVHNAVTQCEPNAAAGMVRGSHAFFRARSPAGFDSRRAKCD